MATTEYPMTMLTDRTPRDAAATYAASIQSAYGREIVTDAARWELESAFLAGVDWEAKSNGVEEYQVTHGTASTTTE